MKACPFCSYNESVIQPYHEDSFMPDRNTPAKYRVVCTVCFAEGPPSVTQERATEKWDGILSQINGDGKFKEGLNEASYVLNPRDMFWYAWEAYVGNVYEEDEEGISQIMKNVYKLGPDGIKDSYDLLDAVANVEFANGPIPEEDLDIFIDILYDHLKSGEFINEMDGGAPAGGVSAPMATLTNTPGVGNAVPAPEAGLNTDGPSGSGDKWGEDEEKPKKKKKKIAVKESYNDFEDIDPEYTGKQYVGYNNRRWEVVDYRRSREPEVLIRPLLNPYKNGPASMSNARIGSLWIAINQLDVDDDIYEMNTNPYDKIADMMSKKMGTPQPFKKKDSKTNTVKQKTIDETNIQSSPFQIETLDSYQKASSHVPDHPLTSAKKKKKNKKKMNEEETPAEIEAQKDIKAKNKLSKLGIPFSYKPGKSGKQRVFLGMNVNDAVDKLIELDWEKVGDNPENTIKKFHKDGEELSIYTDVNKKSPPIVTLKNISESNEIPDIKLKKMISNTLEPYMKK